MLSPLDRPRCMTAADLRQDPGLIVASLASRLRIAVYWDGMPNDACVRTGLAPSPGRPGGRRPG